MSPLLSDRFFFRIRYPGGQQAHEKMLSITNYQRNENQIYSVAPTHTDQNGHHLKVLGLVHGDDPERCYGEGGGRGVHVWERM